MRIALDAMGGDYAPLELVRGAINTASTPDFSHQLILVGDEAKIKAAFAELNSAISECITIHHTTEIIEMDEHPAHAIRKKRDSSLVVCGQMVKAGEADATVSAGNTGAAMAIGALDIGRIKGIERPAIATVLPTTKGRALLCDAGANVDCSPNNLVQFAMMASVYAELVLGITNPSIGLLNVGAEPGKGNELTKATHTLLTNVPLNFYGNVEGKDVWEHTTDVIICDGFDGNVLLKTAEGFAEWMTRQIKTEAASAAPEEQLVIKKLLGRLFQRIDYAEYGAAPLLGVNAITLIAHGRSKAKAFESAIQQAIAAAGSGLVSGIRDGLSRLKTEVIATPA